MDRLEQLFSKSYKKAYRAAKSILFDSAAAEDAVSEALIRLLKTFERKKRIENAEAYFIRITVNEAKRLYRKRKELPSDKIADYMEAARTYNAQEDEAAYQLLVAVSKLDQTLALPIKLHYYGGFSEKEVADMLNLSYGALKTRISRAKAKLKEILCVETNRLRGDCNENYNC